LSKIMGVNQSLISFYERGEKKPGMKTLKKFVDKANKEFKMKITYSDIEI
jgi:predicted transcriptional regulator